MDGKQLQSQYKDHLSDFQNWDQRAHAQEYILYPKNMGYRLCIDETGLSLKPWGIALKFLFLHHENILFPND